MKLFSTRQKRFQARTERGWSQDGLWKAILMHPSFMRATFSRCLSFDCLWGEHLWAVSYLTSHCCDEHCYPGQLWRRKGLFGLCFHYSSSAREVKTGSWGWNRSRNHEGRLLSGLFSAVLSVSFYIQDRLSMYCFCLLGPSHINHQ